MASDVSKTGIRGHRAVGRRAVLLLGAAGSLVANAAVAQDDQARGVAMIRYQTDAGCAAAAEGWLIAMSNGTPTQEQNEALDVLGFFVADAQISAQAAGRPAIDGFGATQAFVADLLPRLKSPDAAEAEKARTEVAAATHRCATCPEFQTRAKSGTP